MVLEKLKIINFRSADVELISIEKIVDKETEKIESSNMPILDYIFIV